MSKIILYTSHCPRCRILEMKLQKKNIEYTENEDFTEPIEKGYKSAPLLQVDDDIMEFTAANKWINEQ